MSVYLGIDKWGVVEGGWNLLVMVHIEGGLFLFFVFFLLYVCMIDNSITFFGLKVLLITDGWCPPSKSERSLDFGRHDGKELPL